MNIEIYAAFYQYSTTVATSVSVYQQDDPLVWCAQGYAVVPSKLGTNLEI
jgi:hypothetical protein